jgi:hypothetical protein
METRHLDSASKCRIASNIGIAVREREFGELLAAEKYGLLLSDRRAASDE